MDARHGPAVSSIEWRKASYSTSNGGACVEVAVTGDTVAVRDSKDPEGRPWPSGQTTGQCFTAGLKLGRFNAL